MEIQSEYLCWTKIQAHVFLPASCSSFSFHRSLWQTLAIMFLTIPVYMDTFIVVSFQIRQNVRKVSANTCPSAWFCFTMSSARRWELERAVVHDFLNPSWKQDSLFPQSHLYFTFLDRLCVRIMFYFEADPFFSLTPARGQEFGVKGHHCRYQSFQTTNSSLDVYRFWSSCFPFLANWWQHSRWRSGGIYLGFTILAGSSRRSRSNVEKRAERCQFPGCCAIVV